MAYHRTGLITGLGLSTIIKGVNCVFSTAYFAITTQSSGVKVVVYFPFFIVVVVVVII